MSDANVAGATNLAALKAAARWLNGYASNVTSQCGEDGILAKCLDLLPATDKWCVEFGAYDGKEMSNTYSLIADRGYRAVLIEPNDEHFRKLDTAFEYRDRVIPVQAFVGFTESDGLDRLLSPLPIPTDFDVLVIDVDGNDYHIWDAIRRYRPKIVAVEYNFTIANWVHFIQEKSPSVSQGSSALAITQLGKAKGYELVATTPVNLIFVDGKYFERFGIPDNSLELIRDDSGCPAIFVTYDGHVKLAEKGGLGKISLKWHDDIPLREDSIQVLPRFLRTPRTGYPPWKVWALRLRYPASLGPNARKRAVADARSLLARTLGRLNPFR